MWFHTIVGVPDSINLLAFYHECRLLIGYATHYIFCKKIVSSLAVCGC